jgi:hypothetical protein
VITPPVMTAAAQAAAAAAMAKERKAGLMAGQSIDDNKAVPSDDGSKVAPSS